MILTAYLDESGVDRASPLMIVGGYVGNARRWKDAEKAFKKLLFKNGIKHFHATDMDSGRGAFRSWSRDSRMAFLGKMESIAQRYLDIGIVAILEKKDFEDHYASKKKSPELPKDSEYGVCFRWVLALLISFAKYKRRADGLHVVVEHGHRNVGGAADIFHDYKERWVGDEKEILKTISIASGKDTPLLGFADAIVYTAHLLHTKELDQIRVTPFDPTSARGAGKIIARIEADALEQLARGSPPRVDPELWG